MTYGSPAHRPSMPSRGRRCALRLGLVGALTAVTLALLPGAAAQARVPKVFFGIDQGGTLAERDFQQMHAIKVRTMRITVNWSLVEPARGHFDWSRTDARVAALARNRISPAISLYGAPRWATGSGNSAVPPLSGDASRAWQAFLTKVVKRYKKGGQFWKAHPALNPRPATSWQIWNEPNLSKYFARPGPLPTVSVPQAPKAYARLVKASDKAIHRADKHAKVVLAGLSGNPKGSLSAPEFISKLLRVKGISRHFDAAAIHPYTPKVRNLKVLLSKFRKKLDRRRAKRKQIWLTEIGWGSANDSHSMNKGLAGQASALQKSFKLILKNRRKWNIGRVYWFDWRDPPPGGRALCTFCPSAGLLRHDGSHKPAYNRFKRFARQQGRRGGHRRHHHHRHRRR